MKISSILASNVIPVGLLKPSKRHVAYTPYSSKLTLNPTRLLIKKYSDDNYQKFNIKVMKRPEPFPHINRTSLRCEGVKYGLYEDSVFYCLHHFDMFI